MCSNVAVPSSSPVLQKLQRTFGVSVSTFANKENIRQFKICDSCNTLLKRCEAFKALVESAVASESTEDVRSKRMLFQQTPSPSVGKYKKKTCLNLIQKKSSEIIFESDHNYSATGTPKERAHIAAKKTMQQLFKMESKKGEDIILQNTELRESFERTVLAEIDAVCNCLCSKTISPGPSVLRELQNPDQMQKKDVLSLALLELQNSMPFVFKVMHTLAATPSDTTKQKTNSCLATMYALAMHNRNKDLCAVQKLNMCILMKYHAGNEVFDVLNKCGVTLAADSKYKFLDCLGQFNTSGLIESIRKGRPGKITTDNIDGRQIAKQIRLGKGNQHFHYTASTYYPDRVDTSNLSMAVPKLRERISLGTFFLSGREEMTLKQNYAYMVSEVNQCCIQKISMPGIM